VRFLRGVRAKGFLDFIGELWREFGDVFQVRIASRTLVFAMHPQAVEHVNVVHRQNYDKRDSYEPVRKYLTGEGLVSSTGEVWRRQRKLLAPFFTPKGIQAYAQVMIRDGERLVERWEGLARAGGEVDIPREMSTVTASIILKAMFSTETLESIHRMKDAVETMVSWVSDRSTSLSLPPWLPMPANRRYRAARELMHRSISDLVAKRRATDEAQWPDDLLSRMMRTRDEETGAPMSEGLLRDETITAFVAGHETTARTLTFTWYALAANPHAAERLHEELDRVLNGRLPTVDDLRQLPYTLQVLKEVLRLYPAAPFYARDALGPDQLDGHDVPAGAGIMLSPYYTHRHPLFWDEPDRFDPDRWTREREAMLHGHQYHPFAAGPRICIGNNFSLLESHLLLAILAQRFAPRLREGYRAQWEMLGVLGLKGGLPMVIAPRA
jgi:cytochrome P450